MSKTNLVFGVNAVLEAIIAGKTIDKIFIDKAAKGTEYQDLSNAIRQYQIPYSRVPSAKLNMMIKQNHQGVIALLSPVPLASLSNIIQATYEQGKTPLIVMLDGVTDVGNLGAIVRTAVCMGADALVLPTQGSASLGGAAMKTSAGALAHLPICRVNHLRDSIEYLQASGLQIIACHEKTQNSIYRTDLAVPTAILLGAEDKGIQTELLKKADNHASIPMVGPINSLNVSVAAAVILYEAFRQRNTTFFNLENNNFPFK
jgi:23S rRNA (guanosine2251-2'-O)-methyltransferase